VTAEAGASVGGARLITLARLSLEADRGPHLAPAPFFQPLKTDLPKFRVAAVGGWRTHAIGDTSWRWNGGGIEGPHQSPEARPPAVICGRKELLRICRAKARLKTTPDGERTLKLGVERPSPRATSWRLLG